LITSNIIILLVAYNVISKAVSCIKIYNVGINMLPTLSGPNIFNLFCCGIRTIIVSQCYGSWYCFDQLHVLCMIVPTTTDMGQLNS